MIERLFGSKLRAKVLGWFFTHVDERYFVRQLESLLAEDPTNLSRELARLENVRVLVSEMEGRQKYFKVNKSSPFYNEMKGLILKTVGVAGTVKTAIERVPEIRYAFIHGSFAKNQENPQSDVDLIIIGKTDLDEIEDAISKVERKLGRAVYTTCYSLKEWHKKTGLKDR